MLQSGSHLRPTRPRALSLAVDSVAARIGNVLTIEEWAERVRVPRRDEPARSVDGPLVKRILGIHGKSWAPEEFSRPEVVLPVCRVCRPALFAGFRPAFREGLGCGVGGGV